MRLNGEIKALKEPVALSDFLTQEGFSDKRIAVEKKWGDCSERRILQCNSK